VNSAVPIKQPISSSKPVNGANTRPVFRQPSGIAPSSSNGGRNKQNQTPQLPSATSPPHPSRPPASPLLKASLKHVPTPTKTNNPRDSSATLKQHIRHGPSTPKPTLKAIGTTKSPPTIATSAKAASISGQPTGPDVLAKSSPQSTSALPRTTTVAFRPAPSLPIDRHIAAKSEPVNTSLAKSATITKDEGLQKPESTKELNSGVPITSATALHLSQAEPKQLSKASRKRAVETQPGSGHMKKNVAGSRRNSKMSTSQVRSGLGLLPFLLVFKLLMTLG